jgi:membrane carboxypeptidase/penicillin-binding protein PbpC
VTSPQIAYLAHHVLSDATARWASLGYPNPLEIGRPVGAKIGQVQGGAQFWTAGYTPQRTVVFWLGLPDAEPVVPSGLQPRMAAGMWHAVMQYAARELPPSDWPQPAGITRIDVCDPSGLLPTQACPGVVREIFMTGSEPSAPDSLYRTFQINRETGRLATVFTPPGLVEERTFLVPPAQARGWAAAAGLPIPPEDYDAILSGQPDPNVQITAPAVFAYTRGEVRVRGTAAGENFRAYQVLVGQGLNPDTWQQIGLEGNAPVEEDLLAVWDTHGLEGLYAVRLQVVRQDQTVDIATIQVTLDNTPPVARIPYPVNEQVFRLSASRQITFQADVQDAVGVQRLEWSVDNQPVGTTTQEPFVLAWRAVRGAHVLSVQAFDLAGNPSAKEQVRFTVE